MVSGWGGDVADKLLQGRFSIESGSVACNYVNVVVTARLFPMDESMVYNPAEMENPGVKSDHFHTTQRVN